MSERPIPERWRPRYGSLDGKEESYSVYRKEARSLIEELGAAELTRDQLLRDNAALTNWVKFQTENAAQLMARIEQLEEIIKQRNTVYVLEKP